MYDNEKYRQIIKSRLKPKRYEHSLAVAAQAVVLAEKYGCDKDKAYTAGLLHDIMKNSSEEEMLHILSRVGIMLNDVEKNAVKLWHAIAGYAYLKAELGITDDDILNSVRYHTTARKGMSVLEKVVYLADFTSADRDYDGVEDMRAAVQMDLDKAMFIALQYSVNELVGRGSAVHTDTIDAYNETVLSMITEGD